MHAYVSIVIPNYDYARFLPALFEGLAAQTMGLRDVEILVVDDGSGDDSVAVAEALGPGLGAGRFKVLPIRHLGRPGLVRNVGLAQARGRLVLCLDPDDSPAPDYLERLVAALEAHSEAGFAYTDYVEAAPGGDRTIRLPEFSADLLRTQNVLPSAALVRREVLRACRGYAANTAYEDWDLWVKAAARGFTGVRVPEPLFRYNMHGANFSHRARREDGPAKARIVLNSRSFFDPEVVAWARALLAGVFWAAPFGRGLIPRPEDVRALRSAAGAALERRTRTRAAGA